VAVSSWIFKITPPGGESPPTLTAAPAGALSTGHSCRGVLRVDAIPRHYFSNRKGIFFLKGTVKWFNNEKGFGFLIGENGKDFFVHYKKILMDGFKTLQAGQLVEFEPGTDERGRECAVDVKAV